jgi:hypothetical protein
MARVICKKVDTLLGRKMVRQQEEPKQPALRRPTENAYGEANVPDPPSSRGGSFSCWRRIQPNVWSCPSVSAVTLSIAGVPYEACAEAENVRTCKQPDFILQRF